MFTSVAIAAVVMSVAVPFILAVAVILGWGWYFTIATAIEMLVA